MTIYATTRLNRITCPAFCFISMLPVSVAAREYFNPAFLESNRTQQVAIDLSLFENTGAQLPGTYQVDLFMNDRFIDRQSIDFYLADLGNNKTGLQPCLSIEALREFGVKVDAFSQLRDDTRGCANLSAIPQASAEFDFAEQALRISIPQAALDANARGYIDPESWDQGIPALMLNYSYSGANWKSRDGKSANSNYLNLRPGLNLGPWRLRNYSTWSNADDRSGKWESLYTYLQRDITSLRSQLVLGDSNSSSEVFDSVPFRGGQLYSDDQMQPDSLRGYAPVIRGIARTNAQVTITQNGYTIYQSYVSPGEFVINDLYSGSSGELKVVVKEADGSEQISLVPYASVAVMQREGRYKYEIVSGQYRAYNSDTERTPFSQGSLIYGLPWNTTLYSGLQTASKHQSLLFGVGKNMGDIGALSFDITQSWASPEHQEKSRGQSLRLRYNKNIFTTGTNFAMAGYRYSTSGFYTLGETLDSYNNSYRPERRRNRTEFNINQNLGLGLGYLAASLINEDYWTNDNRTTSAMLSYSNSWNNITYNLSYSHNLNVTSSGDSRRYDKDNMFNLSVSMPLNKWLGGNIQARYNVYDGENRTARHSVGLNGSALEDNNLYWNMQQSFSGNNSDAASDASVSYNGSYAQIGAGYSYTNDSQQLNYNLEGGMLVHPNGITLAQSLGETIALIEAPGAPGVSLNNQSGVATDFRGYTIAPWLTPYRETTLQLRPDTLPEDVELEISSQKVVPTRGAVVRASFNPAVGKRLMMTLTLPQNEPVPFGAIVNRSDDQRDKGSIVGDNGTVFLTGMDNKGILNVRWGKAANQRCTVNYRLSGQEPTNSGIVYLSQRCQ